MDTDETIQKITKEEKTGLFRRANGFVLDPDLESSSFFSFFFNEFLVPFLVTVQNLG